MTSQIKLIALDLDGTLLNSKMNLSYYTINCINECAEKGILIAIISGRSLNDMKSVTKKINARYLSALNGSVLFNNSEQKIIPYQRARNTILHDLIQYLSIQGYCWNAFSGLECYISGFSPDPLSAIYQKSLNPLIGFPAPLISIDSIQILSRSAQEAGATQKMIREKWGIQIEAFNMGYNMIQITGKNINKGSSLEKIAQLEKIDFQNILAIGDSEGDIPMLDLSGLKAAMKNSHLAAMKPEYPVTLKTADEDGAAEWIKSLLHFQ